MQQTAAAIAAWLDRACAAAAWLVLPLALLLFAQWPLRDLVGAWSHQANDAAQWLFALYVAFALREATRRRAHLACGLPGAGRASPWRARIDRYGESLLVLPWGVFVLAVGAAPTWRSVAGLEAFPDTYDPLYFVVRVAAWLLALGLVVQALLSLLGPAPGEDAGTDAHRAGQPEQ